MNASSVRGRPRSETTHRAILDAAFQILQREGYRGAAIERIAAEAGVAKQTIYRRWPSKAFLFLEVLGDRAISAAPLPDTGTLKGDLNTLLEGTFRAVSGDLRPLMRALAVELLQDDEFAKTMRDVFVQRRRENVRTIVDRAITRREVSTEFDIELLCDLIYGSMWYRLMFDHAPLDAELAKSLTALIDLSD